MSFVPSGEDLREFVPGSSKAVKNQVGAKVGELWMVPLDQIRVVEGFNIRVQDPENEDAIERIKDSIIANGFYRNQPLKGYIGKEDGEDVLYCCGGFSRLEAARRAARAGFPLKEIPVVPVPPGTSMADLTIGLIVDNEGRPNSPYEKGIGIKRLVNWGWTEKEIAEKLGLSLGYIKELLYLQGLPQGLQNLVVDGYAKAGHVINMARQHGPEAALAMLEDEVKKLTLSDPPLGHAETTTLDGDGSAGRPRPRNRPRGITTRVALGAVDYTIELYDNAGPEPALDFLARWRKEDPETLEELKARMKKKKVEEPAEEL
jgi:ParB-like chromosome segregation protein Spo0J